MPRGLCGEAGRRFFAFLSQLNDGSVVVIHELGDCRLDTSGKILWNCTTDEVTDFAEERAFVRLQTDAGVTTVNTTTGDPL